MKVNRPSNNASQVFRFGHRYGIVAKEVLTKDLSTADQEALLSTASRILTEAPVCELLQAMQRRAHQKATPLKVFIEPLVGRKEREHVYRFSLMVVTGPEDTLSYKMVMGQYLRSLAIAVKWKDLPDEIRQLSKTWFRNMEEADSTIHVRLREAYTSLVRTICPVDEIPARLTPAFFSNYLIPFLRLPQEAFPSVQDVQASLANDRFNLETGAWR